jgi:hypothetical protein
MGKEATPASSVGLAVGSSYVRGAGMTKQVLKQTEIKNGVSSFTDHAVSIGRVLNYCRV